MSIPGDKKDFDVEVKNEGKKRLSEFIKEICESNQELNFKRISSALRGNNKWTYYDIPVLFEDNEIKYYEIRIVE